MSTIYPFPSTLSTMFWKNWFFDPTPLPTIIPPVEHLPVNGYTSKGKRAQYFYYIKFLQKNYPTKKVHSKINIFFLLSKFVVEKYLPPFCYSNIIHFFKAHIMYEIKICKLESYILFLASYNKMFWIVLKVR